MADYTKAKRDIFYDGYPYIHTTTRGLAEGMAQVKLRNAKQSRDLYAASAKVLAKDKEKSMGFSEKELDLIINQFESFIGDARTNTGSFTQLGLNLERRLQESMDNIKEGSKGKTPNTEMAELGIFINSLQSALSDFKKIDIITLQTATGKEGLEVNVPEGAFFEIPKSSQSALKSFATIVKKIKGRVAQGYSKESMLTGLLENLIFGIIEGLSGTVAYNASLKLEREVDKAIEKIFSGPEFTVTTEEAIEPYLPISIGSGFMNTIYNPDKGELGVNINIDFDNITHPMPKFKSSNREFNLGEYMNRTHQLGISNHAGYVLANAMPGIRRDTTPGFPSAEVPADLYTRAKQEVAALGGIYALFPEYDGNTNLYVMFNQRLRTLSDMFNEISKGGSLPTIEITSPPGSIGADVDSYKRKSLMDRYIGSRKAFLNAINDTMISVKV